MLEKDHRGGNEALSQHRDSTEEALYITITHDIEADSIKPSLQLSKSLFVYGYVVMELLLDFVNNKESDLTKSLQFVTIPTTHLSPMVYRAPKWR